MRNFLLAKTSFVSKVMHMEIRRKVETLLCSTLVLLLLCGCKSVPGIRAKTIQYPPLPDQTKRVEDPTKARIYLMSRDRFFGCAASIMFYGSNPSAPEPAVSSRGRMRLVGEVGPGGYICWEESPHLLTLQKVQGDTNSLFTLDLQASNVYYLRASMKFGLVSAKSVIEPLDEKHGRVLLKKCRPPEDYRIEKIKAALPVEHKGRFPDKFRSSDGRAIEIGARSETNGGWTFKSPRQDNFWVADGFNFTGYDTLYIAPTLSNFNYQGIQGDLERVAKENLAIELRRFLLIRKAFPNIVTREQDIPPGARVLRLENTIVDFDKGDMMARYGGGMFGAGQPVLGVKGTMTDGDKVVFTYQARRSGVSFNTRMYVMTDIDVQRDDIRSLTLDLSDFIAALSGHYAPRN